MRKLVTILIKVLKTRVCSEKRNIASEENDNETNIEEKETEDQDFLICVKSLRINLGSTSTRRNYGNEESLILENHIFHEIKFILFI